MDWYYSQDGQSVGPVNEDQFNALVRTGVITPKTNVWNSGMAAWQLYQHLAPITPLSAPIPNQEEAEADSLHRKISFDTSDLEKALAKAAAAARVQPVVSTPTPSPVADPVSHDLEEALAKASAAAQMSEASTPVKPIPSASIKPEIKREEPAPVETLVNLKKAPEPAPVVVPEEEPVIAASVKPLVASAAPPEETAASAAPSFVDAGFGFRFAAAMMDILIYAALFFVILIPLTGSFFISETVEPGQVFARFEAGFLFLLGLHLGYQTFFVGKYGDTPGKMIFHLKVVREDGKSLTYRHAFKRGLGELLTGITLGMGYLWAVKDGEKRALHDRLCATWVIKKA
jgi:uncharacterized RDD family membrane protein YckC